MQKTLAPGTQYYVDINKPMASIRFIEYFSSCLHHVMQGKDRPVVILCIGTDRSTGDSLGPLIGYKLAALNLENVHVFGTLDEPVHAKNLQQKIEEIQIAIENPVIVAIDACLGSMDHVGYIMIQNEGIKPGAGVKKDLPMVGDISIMGIVNFGGFMEFMILQNTRLNLVMKMVDIITPGIRYALWKIFQRRLPEDRLEFTSTI